MHLFSPNRNAAQLMRLTALSRARRHIRALRPVPDDVERVEYSMPAAQGFGRRKHPHEPDLPLPPSHSCFRSHSSMSDHLLARQSSMMQRQASSELGRPRRTLTFQQPHRARVPGLNRRQRDRGDGGEASAPHHTQKSFYDEISRARHNTELVTVDAKALRETLEAATGERVAALDGVGVVAERTRNEAKAAMRVGHGVFRSDAPYPSNSGRSLDAISWTMSMSLNICAWKYTILAFSPNECVAIG